MKKFLGKHWRSIIYFFVVIGVVINLYATIMTPATIVKDYAEYIKTYTANVDQIKKWC